MSEVQNGQNPEPTGNEPLKWMSREQRLAFLEDLVVLLATFVVGATKTKSATVNAEKAEVMAAVSALVAQMPHRPAEDNYE